MSYIISRGYFDEYFYHKLADLEWTTEPPTQAGWYWVKNGEEIEMKCIYEQIIEDVPMLYITLPGRQNFPFPVSDLPTNNTPITHWLGPLPIPEPPKEHT